MPTMVFTSEHIKSLAFMLFAYWWGFCLMWLHRGKAEKSAESSEVKIALHRIVPYILFILPQTRAPQWWRSSSCRQSSWPPRPGSCCAVAGSNSRSSWTLSTPACQSVPRPAWRSCASHTGSFPALTSWRTGSRRPFCSSDASPDSTSAPTTPSRTMWRQVWSGAVMMHQWINQSGNFFQQR